MHPLLDSELYLATSIIMRENPDNFKSYSVILVSELEYVPFCQDFGPLNLSQIHFFISKVNTFRENNPSRKIVCVAEGIQSELTNGVLLLGCYLSMTLGLSPEDVYDCFDALSPYMIPYRDATLDWSDFELPLIDCWRALRRATDEGWLMDYDMAEYAHYDNPLEGNMHAVIPGRLIALQGPKSLPGRSTFADHGGQRTFSPGFYVEPFQDMGVSTVVRLNEREYADAEFEDRGVRCVSLEFDGPIPPPDVVIAFLHTMHTARGAVAVHCRSGLGRTGTLCALHLMLSHGFGAGEAIAWMRVTLPGSIAGEEHEHLRALQAMVAVLLQTHPPLTGFTVESASPQAVATSFDAADNCPAQEALLESLPDVNAAPADSSAPSSTAAFASPAAGLHLLARGPPPIALAHRALLRIQQLDLASSCGGGRPRPESPVFGSLRGRWEAK